MSNTSESEKKNEEEAVLNGPLFSGIIKFALPLSASSMLQQLFNAADTAVVGRFASSNAMAAVGANSSIINLIVSLFIGLSIGTNVVVATLIGRGEEKRISSAVHTSIMIALISGVALIGFGNLFARPLLVMTGTPDEVMSLAVLYLRIYFLGMPFMMLYNFESAILRSMGDSRRPLVSLTIAGVINVLLNLFLVIVCHLSVAGVAIATVISNVVSSVILFVDLCREEEPYRLSWKKMAVRRKDLFWIIRIGVPAGLQGMVFSFSNVVIQAGINSFGESAIAASAAAVNFEYICYFMINAFSQASITYTSQNYAAGNIGRCKKIIKITLIMGMLCCAAMNVMFVLMRGFWLSFFTTDEEVLRICTIRMTHVLLFQWIAATYEVSGSTMRALGYSLTPSLLTILGSCIFRIFWIVVLLPRVGTFSFLMDVYPVSWILTGILVMGAYVIVARKCCRKIA